MNKKNKKSQKHGQAPVGGRTTEPESVETSDKSEQITEDSSDLEREMGELTRRFQRLGADYQNYQKRAEKQIEQAAGLARENLVKSLLPVLDNFEHTLDSLETPGESQDITTILKGVRIVYDHLMSDMETAGLERIQVKQGESFDPTLHEAMLQEESDEFENNTIIRELIPGYMMNGRTLRPTRVSVAKSPAAPTVPEDSDKTENPEPEE
ncbi:MAG: nucleotide exchange factor GrpE [Sedimentisphaerales bacterium]|nr:nucleotide exchange factor GrpE [Sedimentisphaerales bacterium]